METNDLKKEERNRECIKKLDDLFGTYGVDGWEDAVKRVLYKLIEATDYGVDAREELFTAYVLMEFFHKIWMYDLKNGKE
jgi:hypothetical protein